MMMMIAAKMVIVRFFWEEGVTKHKLGVAPRHRG